MPSRKTTFSTLGVVVWLAAIGIGFGSLQRYAALPGGAQAPSAAVRELVSKHRKPHHGLVIMAVHPRCPCTAASLGELGDLLARSKGTCTALIVEYQPLHPAPDWPEPAAFRSLGGMRVPVLADPGGTFAAALGAQTSGHLVFADATGIIRFHGGLTISRGHRGRSPAQDAILALLEGNQPLLSQAPVHGCALGPECKPESAQ